jgi:hypothetical protein
MDNFTNVLFLFLISCRSAERWNRFWRNVVDKCKAYIYTLTLIKTSNHVDLPVSSPGLMWAKIET